MQGLIGVTRTYRKHAAILLASGLLFQLAACHSGAKDQPKRPRITGIHHIRVYATKIDKSCLFYAQVLGLTSRDDCADATRPHFEINWGQQIELEGAPSSLPRNLLAEIAFATDDVPRMRRYLLTHGVAAGAISDDPVEPPHFQVRDPEGNPIAFVQPWERLPDGIGSGASVSGRLLHAGFVVKDIAAENRFYRDVLGFKLYWQGGMKDDGLDWYELQVPDGDNWIEYMLNIPASADHKALGAQNHFSFGVKEIEAAAAQLRKNGATKIAGPGIGRDGKRGLNVYDPDDTRVEVTEFTPAREPCCHAYTAAHPTP
jgi:catechol 2,3-dioxygenase-like lactoylglutathione lyase family enzyme